MEVLGIFFDLFMNLDEQIGGIIEKYGALTYLLLFLIVFLETGVVVTPFLPGDSLLFVVGTFASQGVLDIWISIIILCVAAILGDTVNYQIGSFLGAKVFTGNSRFLNMDNLKKTQQFYKKHGKNTIILARFVPIIRTYAPFVAGVGSMNYRQFLTYNVIGAVLWVVLLSFGGYFFGNLPIVKENFSLVILMIIFISALPAVISYFKTQSETTNDEV
jgi:membrane-associated protein